MDAAGTGHPLGTAPPASCLPGTAPPAALGQRRRSRCGAAGGSRAALCPTGDRGSTARLPVSGPGAVGICRKRSTRGFAFGLHPAEKFWREDGAVPGAARRRDGCLSSHSGSWHREFVHGTGASPVPCTDLGRASAQRCLECTNLLAAS